MEKIILVFYIDVGGLPPMEAEHIINRTRKSITSDKTEDLLYYIVPTRNETKVECINPKLVTEEEYKNAQQMLDTMKAKLELVLGTLETKE